MKGSILWLVLSRGLAKAVGVEQAQVMQLAYKVSSQMDCAFPQIWSCLCLRPNGVFVKFIL